jgi:hypothetical protein
VPFREEVLNVVVAQLLGERAVVSMPEQIERWGDRSRRLPDVLVEYQGLRTVIEGKVDDHGTARSEVEANAFGRVEEGVAHIGIATLYPGELRSLPSLAALRDGLASATLEIAIYTESGTDGWMRATLDQLAELLRRTFDQLVEEDVVALAVAVLEAGVDSFARGVATMPASIERSADVLGISEPEQGDVADDGESE